MCFGFLNWYIHQKKLKLLIEDGKSSIVLDLQKENLSIIDYIGFTFINNQNTDYSLKSRSLFSIILSASY